MKHPPFFRTLAPAMISVVLVWTTGAALGEEILFLTNGRRIVVERFWEEEDQIFYELNGGVFGFPRHLLEKVESADPEPQQAEDASRRSGFRNVIARETIERARDSARDGDVDEAARLYENALRKAPDAVTTRLELARLYFERGDLYLAQSQLQQAKRIDPENAEIRELLGDVFYRRGRIALAIREWQLALEIQPDAGILYKLKKALRENDEDINFEEVQGPHFVIRYDGQVNQTIGRIVAAALDEEYYQLSRELRFSPSAPIQVTLYTNREFQDVTHAPSWVSALNDGEIRVPVEGLTAMTPKLRRVLRHELTHSFVNALTAGNCPSWFHEGLAQFHEGETLRGDPYPRVRAAQARGELIPLWSLEGPLINYSREKVQLVYSEALAATEYLALRRGRGALVRILQHLAEQRPMNDALRRVIGLDYQEFQTAWEADLRRYRAR